MTFSSYLLTQLEAHGLWPDEAFIVLSKIKEEEDTMTDRWDDKLSDYPDGMKTLIWLHAKNEAIKYLKNNKPNHFAFMMLTGV